MMKLRSFVSLFLGVFLLALMLVGCTSDQAKPSGLHNMNMNMNMSMEPIEVELRWSPDEIVVNQKITFEALVTQDSAPVDDAKEVLFEVKSKDYEDHKLEFQGKLVGDGIYQAEGIIKLAGVYTVTSHVTARSLHSMPSKELTVNP